MKIIESNGSAMTIDVKSEARPQLAERTRQLWDYVSEVVFICSIVFCTTFVNLLFHRCSIGRLFGLIFFLFVANDQ